jgi:hypothetical protein
VQYSEEGVYDYPFLLDRQRGRAERENMYRFCHCRRKRPHRRHLSEPDLRS